MTTPALWLDNLARLDPEHPPGDVPLHRWQTFIADCRAFIETGGADRAAALGWDDRDLVGCDRVAPFARVDRAGLLLALNGDAITEICIGHAVIQTRTGSCQRYFPRARREPGDVLIWQLAPSVKAAA